MRELFDTLSEVGHAGRRALVWCAMALAALVLLLAAWPAAAHPVCSPAEVRDGTGSPFLFRMDGACYSYGWTCRENKKHVIVAGQHAAFITRWRERGMELKTGTHADVLAAWDEFNVDGNAIPGACNPLVARVKAALDAQWASLIPALPPQAYVVAPAAANANPPGTRPAFPIANGVRGTVSNGRATSGAACNCTVKDGDYCGVNGRTDQVALCTSAP